MGSGCPPCRGLSLVRAEGYYCGRPVPLFQPAAGGNGERTTQRGLACALLAEAEQNRADEQALTRSQSYRNPLRRLSRRLPEPFQASPLVVHCAE